MNDIIELVAYDKTWLEKAGKELSHLKQILNFPFIEDIKHFGSTAILGIKAKPIIDIIIGSTDLTKAKICIPLLEAEGYSYWDKNPKADRMFFTKGRVPLGEKRTHHVHLFETTSYEWIARSLFAEYLNANKSSKAEYEKLKEEMAVKYKDDREAYTLAKGDFVKKINAKAIAAHINFIPLQQEYLPLLKTWLMKPHVKEFWDPEIIWTDALVKEKFGKYAGKSDSSTKAFIITVKNIKIGYIQYYSFTEGNLAENLGMDLTKTCGIDLFIGQEDFLNKGLSIFIIQKFISDCLKNNFEIYLVDPENSNLKAINVYKKAGFKILKEIANTIWMYRK